MAIQLGIWEYVVFSITILATILIGGYRIFKDKLKNMELDYFLFAKRTTGVVPIVLSTMATFISAFTLLAVPAETYMAGITIIHFSFGVILSSIVVSIVYLPTYYKLNVTSVMEYIELRFNRTLRVIAALCCITSRIPYNGIVLLMAALALNQVSGLDIWLSMIPLAVICTVYTALGGFKTVVWTDMVQAILMIATIILLIAKGLISIGGFGVLWERISNGDRATFAYFNTGPTVRYTIWSAYLGTVVNYIFILNDQTYIQRQLALKTLKTAQISLFVSVIGVTVLTLLMNLFGLIMYARYYNCDPLVSGEVKARDQLSAYFAMEILQNITGLTGFYIGGICAATLSTFSSSINSMSIIVLQDLIRPIRSTMSDEDATKISKIIAAIIGMLSLACVVILLYFPSGLEAYFAGNAIAGGTLLGLITLGMLVPFTSCLGAAIGCICGCLMPLWILVGASVSKYIHPYAPVGVSGCNETLAINATLYSQAHYVEHNSSIFPLYKVSFIMYISIGFFTTVVVGSIASLLTGPQNPDELPRGVIYPAVDKLFRKLPKQWKFRLGYRIVNNDTALPGEEMTRLSQTT